MDQLKLALAWNRIDIAKSEIFTDERPWPVSGCPFVLNCPNFNCKKMYVIYDSLQQDVCHLWFIATWCMPFMSHCNRIICNLWLIAVIMMYVIYDLLQHSWWCGVKKSSQYVLCFVNRCNMMCSSWNFGICLYGLVATWCCVLHKSLQHNAVYFMNHFNIICNMMLCLSFMNHYINVFFINHHNMMLCPWIITTQCAWIIATW